MVVAAATPFKRLSTNSVSVDFGVLLSRFLIQIRGVISISRILPPEFESKIGQNNPQKRRNLSSWTVSKSRTQEEAVRVFKGLGRSLWMQIIDLEYQKHGELVFDRGSHGGFKEPGFLRSALEACDFSASSEFKFDERSYCQLHRVACHHFRGKSTATEMSSKHAGIYGEGMARWEKVKEESDVKPMVDE
jgi:hypothetical protein